MKTLALAAAFCLVAAVASAEPAKCGRGPCPTPTPVVTPGNSKTVITDVTNAKADILKALEEIDVADRQIIPGSQPSQMWDAVGHVCIAGIGNPGQPGYVPGLAATVESFVAPPLPPALQGTSPLIAIAEARLVERAAVYNLGLLSTSQYAQNIIMSCGGLIASIGGDLTTAEGQAAAILKLLTTLIPK